MEIPQHIYLSSNFFLKVVLNNGSSTGALVNCLKSEKF